MFFDSTDISLLAYIYKQTKKQNFNEIILKYLLRCT